MKAVPGLPYQNPVFHALRVAAHSLKPDASLVVLSDMVNAAHIAMMDVADPEAALRRLAFAIGKIYDNPNHKEKSCRKQKSKKKSKIKVKRRRASRRK